MIGDIIYIGWQHYIKTNNNGTLEKLPDIHWWRSLQIFWINYFDKQTIGEVRDFYNKYKIGVKI